MIHLVRRELAVTAEWERHYLVRIVDGTPSRQRLGPRPRFDPEPLKASDKGGVRADAPRDVPREVQPREVVEGAHADGAERARRRRLEAEKLKAALPRAFGEAVDAEDAGIALRVELVAQRVEFRAVNAVERAAVREQASEIVSLEVERERLQVDNRLRLACALVDSGDDALDVLGADPRTRDFERRTLEEVPNHHPVERDLHPVIRAIASARLAFHETETRPTVPPQDQNEIDAPLHLPRTEAGADMNLTAVGALVGPHGGNLRAELVPTHRPGVGGALSMLGQIPEAGVTE